MKKLKILLLDGTSFLEYQAGIISSLSALEVFSWFSTPLIQLRARRGNEFLLIELEILEQVTKVSITLLTDDSVALFNSSGKLQRSVKRLTITCPDLFLIDISPRTVRRLEHLETLNIIEGLFLRRLNIGFENKVMTSGIYVSLLFPSPS